MARWRFSLSLVAILVLRSSFAETQLEAEYFAICDAGSTGTRLYVFRLDVSQAPAKAESVFVKKIKPGLSSYAENPQNAVPPLLGLLAEGAQKVPEAIRSQTSLSILGTAGMRMLSSDKQQEVWRAVKQGFSGDSKFPFATDKLEARTVSGNEEGLWAVLTTNFLTGRMAVNLRPHSSSQTAPVGLMDLGGSSTQIAIPSLDHNWSAATIHSYLAFGMTHIREQVRKNTVGGEDAVCYMRGTAVEADLVGTGDAPSCRKLIQQIMKDRAAQCKATADAKGPCPGDLAQTPQADVTSKGTIDFYAVAGFTYVVDFVRWWLELDAAAGTLAKPFLDAFPRPTLAEFQAAADAMCKGDYAVVEKLSTDEKLKHPFTGLDNAPYRCFQANYILVLLRDVYEFGEHGRTITFALEVDGEDLEWPLGALLHTRHASQKLKDRVEL